MHALTPAPGRLAHMKKPPNGGLEHWPVSLEPTALCERYTAASTNDNVIQRADIDQLQCISQIFG